MGHTYSVSCKKGTGNSDMSSKTINNKVKLLKTKCLKRKHDKSIFVERNLLVNAKTNVDLLLLL